MSSDSDDDLIPLAQLQKKNKRKQVKRTQEEDEEEEFQPKKKIKRVKKEEKKPIKKKKKIVSTGKTKAKANVSTKKIKETKVVRKLKVHSKRERLDMAIKAYRWWKAEELPEGIQWRSLEHNGVLFPPSYIPHSIPLLYNGKPIKLTPIQEELASFYASIPSDGPQLGNPITKSIFQQNFFTNFKQILGPKHEIQEFKYCDFSLISEYLEKQREEKKIRSKEEKEVEKEKKEVELYRNGFAIVDGHLEKVGNFRIEPPGLFRGRGEHPKTGTLKERVLPEDVTINSGIEDRVPVCSMPGHAWKQVIHRDSVSWLAYWNENVMNGIKYVWLAASSSFKGKSDLNKYEKARRLKKCIDKIRKDYQQGLKDKDGFIQQRSTAMWVIDVLALRVGNEKGEDEADTVGCCSLRVEHLSFEKEKYTLTLKFLGKDSMPYHNTIELEQYGNIGKRIYTNLQSFCAKKKKEEEVFDALSTSDLNKHLSGLMPGLTAKVFRTFNASVTLEQELPHVIPENPSFEETSAAAAAAKVVLYNDANRKVAILCNHQRTAPKSFDQTVEKLKTQSELYQTQYQELNTMKEALGKGKKNKIRLRTDEKEKEDNHLFSKIPTMEQCIKRMEQWKKKINTLELKLQDKNDNKEIALGTSKINYMDPRISVAWCKRNEVPISSIFTKALREKFVWAMDVDPNWSF